MFITVIMLLFAVLWLLFSSININTALVSPNSNIYYSICNSSTFIFYFLFHFAILFTCYIFQDIESQANLKTKFEILPISFNDFFLSRLIIILLTIFFLSVVHIFLLSLILKLKLGNSLESPLGEYISITADYLYELLIPSVAYVFIVVIISFKIKGLIIGFTQILICFIMSMLPNFLFLPSSFGYQSLRNYHTRMIYPDSIFIDNINPSLTIYSFVISVLIILIVRFRLFIFK